ncbi:MAG TPA: BlaI/MecI/CopY family transcriptional regulator [Vicinamibacterales bacterium]
MPRPPSHGLTDAELRVMNVLWDRGRASVGEVVDGIEASAKPAYNTVLTTLRILERKGYVTHEKDGRAFTYLPLVDRGQERRRAVSHILRRLFNDSPALLVQDLLGHERVDRGEIRDLLELVDKAADGPSPKPARGQQ